MPRNFGPLLWLPGIHIRNSFGVHGTPAQVFVSVRVTPLAGTVAGVYRTAVTTPVWARLRPPQTPCTPSVASGVVTAVPFLHLATNLCEPGHGSF
jgi:hypothetical protein